MFATSSPKNIRTMLRTQQSIQKMIMARQTTQTKKMRRHLQYTIKGSILRDPIFSQFPNEQPSLITNASKNSKQSRSHSKSFRRIFKNAHIVEEGESFLPKKNNKDTINKAVAYNNYLRQTYSQKVISLQQKEREFFHQNQAQQQYQKQKQKTMISDDERKTFKRKLSFRKSQGGSQPLLDPHSIHNKIMKKTNRVYRKKDRTQEYSEPTIQIIETNKNKRQKQFLNNNYSSLEPKEHQKQFENSLYQSIDNSSYKISPSRIRKQESYIQVSPRQTIEHGDDRIQLNKPTINNLIDTISLDLKDEQTRENKFEEYNTHTKERKKNIYLPFSLQKNQDKEKEENNIPQAIDKSQKTQNKIKNIYSNQATIEYTDIKQVKFTTQKEREKVQDKNIPKTSKPTQSYSINLKKPHNKTKKSKIKQIAANKFQKPMLLEQEDLEQIRLFPQKVQQNQAQPQSQIQTKPEPQSQLQLQQHQQQTLQKEGSTIKIIELSIEGAPSHHQNQSAADSKTRKIPQTIEDISRYRYSLYMLAQMATYFSQHSKEFKYSQDIAPFLRAKANFQWHKIAYLFFKFYYSNMLLFQSFYEHVSEVASIKQEQISRFAADNQILGQTLKKIEKSFRKNVKMNGEDEMLLLKQPPSFNKNECKQFIEELTNKRPGLSQIYQYFNELATKMLQAASITIRSLFLSKLLSATTSTANSLREAVLRILNACIVLHMYMKGLENWGIQPITSPEQLSNPSAQLFKSFYIIAIKQVFQKS